MEVINGQAQFSKVELSSLCGEQLVLDLVGCWYVGWGKARCCDGCGKPVYKPHIRSVVRDITMGIMQQHVHRLVSGPKTCPMQVKSWPFDSLLQSVHPARKYTPKGLCTISISVLDHSGIGTFGLDWNNTLICFRHPAGGPKLDMAR